ncbi:hypothetical protein [Glaesserella sp.]|uniref:hypothetical protein n=1 Tax=Glaesserella sp. TaxID=2094731 RepID=UPI00359F1B51
MQIIKQIAPLVAVVLMLGIVGRMDYDDHIKIEQYKCEQNNRTWIVDNSGQYCKAEFEQENR